MTPALYAKLASAMRAKTAGPVIDLARKALSSGAGAVRKGWQVANTGAESAARALDKGSKPTLASAAVRMLPLAGAAYVGKKVYDSNAIQGMKYKYDLWKAQRAAANGGM